MRKTATTLWDPADHLVSEEDVVAYLAAAIADGDPSLICVALADCMRATGLKSAERSDADRRALDPKSKQHFSSVWDAIEDTLEDAENMKLRSVLMTALKNHITRTEMSQARAAKLFGVTQQRVSDLMRGQINLFALDALVNMAAAAGLHIEMRALEAARKTNAQQVCALLRVLNRPFSARVSKARGRWGCLRVNSTEFQVFI